MRKLKFSLILQIVALLVLSITVYPQTCEPPQIIFNKDAPNIFNVEQENYLGEAIAERFQRDYRIIRDEEINSQVRRIGEKIVKHLPQSDINYEFFVVDLPEVNAFTWAGGKVYLTRKLIAFVRNEAELAGIIAHELGHSAVRHSAIDTSKLFKEILGVESVTTRRDIFEKYNQMIDKRRTKSVRISRDHQDDKQLEADRIAVYAMAAAGYDPNEFSTAWDRLAQTKGKTGNWFSDLFGSTKPGEKRLREIIKAIKNLPAECTDNKSDLSSENFEKWQSSVINFANLRGTEKVTALINKQVLSPALRSDINHLKFSRDGKYVIAQDESGISVLQKKPLKFLFRIEAPEARPANFTPDSKAVVFNTTTMRVERWNLATQKPVLMREVFILGDCWQTALSNDGKSFICYSTRGNLEIIDVESNETVFKKEKFYIPSFSEYFSWRFFGGEDGEIDAFQMEFSPDGKYFIAGRVARSFNFYSGFKYTKSAIIGYDFEKKAEIKLDSDLKDIVSSPFAFYTDDKIIGQHRKDDDKSGIFEFPSGKRLDKFLLRGDSFNKPHEGEYLLVRPVSNAPVGVYDLKEKKFIIANKKSALAVYDDTFIAERQTGEVGLYNIKNGKLIEAIDLPESRFGYLRTVSTSSDMKWLAVSDRSRGAVWNLESGERLFYLRGFRGSFFDKDDQLYVDFPATKEAKRQVGLMDIAGNKVAPLHPVEFPNTRQFGKYLVTKKSNKTRKEKDDKDDDNTDIPLVENPDDFSVFNNGTLEVRDIRNNSLLWSRTYEDEMPRYGVSPNDEKMTLVWRLNSKAAKNEIKQDQNLKQMSLQMGDKDGDYFVQVVEAGTGKIIYQTMIETGEGSFRIKDFFATGDLMTVEDTENRVMFYSLKNGQLLHRFFGDYVTVNPQGSLTAIENISGQIAIYDLNSGAKLEEMTFKTPVSYLKFSKDGKKLFVLTSEQEAFTIDATKLGNSEKLADL